MPQTFQDLYNEALGGTSLPDFDSTVYLTRAQQWINDGLHDVARRVSLPLLDNSYPVPVVAGTAFYAVPTDFLRAERLIDTTDMTTLKEVSIETYEGTTSQTGTPTAWAYYDGFLFLTPKPTASTSTRFVLRYVQDPASMALVGSSPVPLPDAYAHMLVCFARARLFRAEDDFDAADRWHAEYERILGRLRADVLRTSTGRRRQIPGRRGVA